jgi:hypothetical protein
MKNDYLYVLIMRHNYYFHFETFVGLKPANRLL